MGIGLIYKNSEKVFEERIVDEVPYLEYPLLSDSGFVKHGFSTRLGGVSSGACSTMNLSFSRGDDAFAVRENYKRMAKAIGVEYDSFVFSAQTHTANIRVVTMEDRGKGLTKPLDYQEIDGLITNVQGICLTTFYADCVPLFFVDPVHKAIGLSHSSWRGTVSRIGQKTVEKMQEEYGTNPSEILAAIGPSICQECYEVSQDVIEEFQKQFEQVYWKELFYQKENGKYQLNLWKANEIVLAQAGILKDHMAVTNVCTCCNSEILFSHRASMGRRGNLAAFLSIK